MLWSNVGASDEEHKDHVQGTRQASFALFCGSFTTTAITQVCDMMLQPELRHGSPLKREAVAPEIGQRIAHPRLAIDLIPAKTYEVNFSAEQDIITMALGPSSGVKSFDSDQLDKFTFCPGEANFHPAGSNVFARSDAQDGELICLVFDSALRESVFSDFDLTAKNILGCYSNLGTSEILRLANFGRRLFLSGRADQRLTVESYLNLVLSETALAMKSQPALPPRAGELRLDTVREYIEANLSENLGLTEIALETGLSTYHFARLFKEEMGLSPHQYVLERRLTRAREMLANNGSTLADIAYAVGFSSQAHMTDVFRKRLGVTPGAYRKESTK